MGDDIDTKNWLGFAVGEPKIWREVLDEIIGKLYAMFLKSWPNRSLAEELVQKTVFEAIGRCEQFDAEKGSPQQWIFGIARNNIRIEIRRRAAQPSMDGDITAYLDAIDSKPLPDEVLERKDLFRRIWNTEYTGDTRTLDVHISWIRQAIEPNPHKPRYLITNRGVGYRLDI